MYQDLTEKLLIIDNSISNNLLKINNMQNYYNMVY